MGTKKLTYYNKTNHYYPFGMLLPNRHESTSEYKFGFGGQEKDDEIKGEGNSYTAKYWQYDSRIGRRWERDPITYPWQSSYATFNNNPIVYNDPLGLYGKNRAERRQKRAVKRYGPKRVTDVHENYNGKKDDWGFGVVNNPKGDNDTHETSDGGVLAYRTTGIYNNKQFRQFDKNKSGNSYREPLKLEEGLSVTTNINYGVSAVSAVNDIVKFNYLLESKYVFQYAQKINGAVVSAKALTQVNSLNALKIVNITSSTAKFLGPIGGVLSAGTNGYETAVDIENGNIGRAYVNGTQTLAYIGGTILLFIPGGQFAGAMIILGASAIDIGQTIAEKKYGADY